MRRQLAVAALGALLIQAAPVTAQSADSEGTVETVNLVDQAVKIDAATIAMPELQFAASPEVEKDFDKYYYFHRADTDFGGALADVRDCDNLARGLASPYGNMDTPYPYNMTATGLIGGAIANVMVAAIFGSAQLRATRRVNMRRCMYYKGYQRFGLPKETWQKFNFEEGFGALEEKKRQAFLMQQAKVASGPMPVTAVLGK